MNAAIKRLLRKEIASLAAVVVGLSVASAQPQRDTDLLQQARQSRELASQKAESDVRNAINKARKLSNSEALALLRDTLASVEANSDLDESRKSSMTQSLRSQIRFTESLSNARGDRGDGLSAEERKDRAAARQSERDKQEQERLKVRDAVRKIDDLVGQGRTQEAERQAKDLAAQFPDNPAARIMGQRSFINSRIREARQLIADQERNISAALAPDKGPPSENLTMDPKVTERNRKSKYRGLGEPLSEKEKKILTALSKTIHPDWQNMKFDSVIDELQKLIGVPLAIDRKSLEDAQIGTDSLVNFSMPQAVSTRTVLRKVLADKGLGYVIKDETIYITTLNHARDMMTTRSYPIGDLVTPVGSVPGAPVQSEDALVKFIIDSIKRSVDPMSWEGEAGRATITYNPITKSLSIRQSAEVHLSLRDSMSR